MKTCEMMRLRVLAAVGLLTSLAGTGCGENWEADTYPATGRVTINGEPPEGAVVQLHPVGEGADVRKSRPWGVVQDDGTFSLSTYERGDGAPPGQYKFTITWPVDHSVPSTADRLGHRYSRPDQSEWTVTIEEGDNELPPIEMTGVAVDMDPSPPPMGGAPMPGPGPNANAKSG